MSENVEQLRAHLAEAKRFGSELSKANEHLRRELKAEQDARAEADAKAAKVDELKGKLEAAASSIDLLKADLAAAQKQLAAVEPLVAAARKIREGLAALG